MPSRLFGIMTSSKHTSKPEPIQVVLIGRLKRNDKVSVLPHWSKGQVIVMLATEAVQRINLSEVIRAMTPEATDW